MDADSAIESHSVDIKADEWIFCFNLKSNLLFRAVQVTSARAGTAVCSSVKKAAWLIKTRMRDAGKHAGESG